jgi:tRNA-dihydrouridine synthase
MVAQTGCDAVMIGRTAPANPWIFRQIEQYVRNQPSALSRQPSANSHQTSAPELMEDVDREGHDLSRADRSTISASASAAEVPSAKLYDEPTEADRYQMIRTYFQMLLEEDIHGAEGKMKQFASWFTHGIPGGAALRKAIYDAKNGAQILGSVEHFFESRLQPAGQ